MDGQTPLIRRLDPPEVALLAPALVDLQRAAYRVEAALIGDDRIPHLTETPAELTAAGLTWLVARSGVPVVAALAYSELSDQIDIDRLVVHPAWHRRGLGRRLVRGVPRRPATVSTGRDNHPARSLYESVGFRHGGDEQVLPDLWVSTYWRR